MKTVSTPHAIRDLLAKAPLGWKRTLTGIANQAGFELERRMLHPPAALAKIRSGPIVVSGFFSDTRGIAQGARLTVAALRSAGFSVVTHDITYLLSGSPRVPGPRGVDGGVWLLHCNPPEADPILRAHPELARGPMYRIGYWAWELPRAPNSWLSLSFAFHEIWAPSEFTAASFQGSRSLVCVMPHPVLPAPATSQAAQNVPIRFLCFADLRSSASRKNPTGAILAFLSAFAAPSHASLTVKLSGAADHPEDLADLCALIGDRPDIRLIDERLDVTQLAGLFAATDILVSLHRAEGFGLPIAEAMAAEKAVIATAWSGNLDYMPDIDVQRVPVTLINVDDRSGIYAGQRWADPDLDRAAASMRRLAGDKELRQACGRANREAVAALAAAWSWETLASRSFSRFAIKSA